jgi:hypothetical protein
VLANATRPASLRYASAEVRWLRLLVNWPWYAFGLAEEKQTVALPMFRGLLEKREAPVGLCVAMHDAHCSALCV